ncbi:F-box protein [Corchorus olitorius]|uniref:F-box protein n=1 Tax=Corchorus olitorius TaxID=93759 RepID=A0A1R3KKR3_9ROSI|nr:F-box protein [Corchorus olitorius]
MRSRKLRPNSSHQQVRKRKYVESPPPQSSKRLQKTNPSPGPLPQEIIVEILLNLPVRSLLRFSVAGKYVDGSLNWMQSTGSSWNIISLDLAQETYKQVPQPFYGDADGVSVKVMKEYGNTESWTKLITIPYLSDGFEVFSTSRFLSGSDEIILRSGGKLILYNLRENV